MGYLIEQTGFKKERTVVDSSIFNAAASSAIDVSTNSIGQPIPFACNITVLNDNLSNFTKIFLGPVNGNSFFGLYDEVIAGVIFSNYSALMQVIPQAGYLPTSSFYRLNITTQNSSNLNPTATVIIDVYYFLNIY